VVGALSKNGNSPVYYVSESSPLTIPGAQRISIARMMDLIHIAADSHLPAILTLRPTHHQEAHAVVVVGHTTIADPSKVVGRRGLMYRRDLPGGFSSTPYVKDFLVHDDAIGPFLRLPQAPGDRFNGPKPRPLFPLDGIAYSMLWDRDAQTDVESVIIPMPAGVRFDPLNAHSVASAFVKAFANTEYKEIGRDRNLMPSTMAAMSAFDANRLVYSCYLDHGGRLRAARRKVTRSGCIQEWAIMGRITLPKYVYVVNIMLHESVAQFGTLASKTVGYVVIDATTVPSAKDVIVIARIGEYIYCADDGQLSGLRPIGQNSAMCPFDRTEQSGVIKVTPESSKGLPPAGML
jgi:hypothetical protein